MIIQSKNSLFRKILGDKLDNLEDSALKRFHDSVHPRGATGELTFTRGRSRVSSLICKLLKFPVGKHQIHLSVEPRGSSDHWHRNADGWQFNSIMYQKKEYLFEKRGLLTVIMSLEVLNNKIVYKAERSKFLFFKLPKWLSIKINSSEDIQGDGWLTEVEIILPLFGKLIKYEGIVRPYAD